MADDGRVGTNKRLGATGKRDVIVNKVVASPVVPRALRWRTLKALGWDVAESTIGANVYFGGSDISIGEKAWFDGDAPVYLAAGVRIGAGVRVLTRQDASGATRDAKPVLIGQGAQIGDGAVILAGVTVGEGAVIDPHAVVGENCSPDTRYAGDPAAAVGDV